MNRDYPLAPTPDSGKKVVVKVKENPNRKVYKRTTTTDAGEKKVFKEVDSKRGYKSVEKVNGKDAIDVEVTTPSKKVSHRFYDATTYLLVKTSK